MERQIENILNLSMDNIKKMIDVNTIVGEAIQASNDTAIIPISKVSFGFASGGSEFKGETIDEYNKRDKDEQIQCRLPFGGGTGTGISIKPVAFLIVRQDVVKLLPIDHLNSIDKILDYMPDLIEKVNSAINKCLKKENDNNPSSHNFHT